MIRAIRTRARRAAAVLTMAAAVLGRSDVAAACSCRVPPPPQEALAQADAVFLGLAQALAAPGAEGAPPGQAAVTFNVERSWKGVEEPYVTVYTAEHTAVCGYPFEVGRRYLVYAAQSAPGVLTTTICTRTADADAAPSDLAELGPGRPSIGGH